MTSEIKYKEISLSIFDELNYPILFGDYKTDRKFGLISNDICTFKFSWQSTDITPEICEIIKGVFAIGIDLNFCLIDMRKGLIELILHLNNFFYTVKKQDSMLYLISELEIIIIDCCNYDVLKKYELPDIFEEIFFCDNEIKAKCFGDNILVFDKQYK